jgi:hypothetical protein
MNDEKITTPQKYAIRLLFKYYGYEFGGTTRKEATEFISAHADEYYMARKKDYDERAARGRKVFSSVFIEAKNAELEGRYCGGGE